MVRGTLTAAAPESAKANAANALEINAVLSIGCCLILKGKLRLTGDRGHIRVTHPFLSRASTSMLEVLDYHIAQARTLAVFGPGTYRRNYNDSTVIGPRGLLLNRFFALRYVAVRDR